MTDDRPMKERLSPKDFAIFSKQCTNDIDRLRSNLRTARSEAARYEKLSQFYTEEINRNKAYAYKHGIEL